jgi:GntR family transcriptional regulator
MPASSSARSKMPLTVACYCPDERLAGRVAISPQTLGSSPQHGAQSSLDGSVAEGLLNRRQGSRNFVAGRVEKNFSALTSFSEDMRARGRVPTSSWLRRSSGTVTPEEALALRASPGSAVYRFERLRYADGAPMALEHATILAYALPS